MASLHFIRIELFRTIKSIYFWVFFVLGMVLNALLPFLTAAADQWIISKDSLRVLLAPSMLGGIAFLLPVIALLFITSDFSSKYIQRSSLFLAGWPRVMLLKWVVLMILAAIFGIVSALTPVLLFWLFISQDPQQGEEVKSYYEGLGYSLKNHASLDDLFTSGLYTSLWMAVIVSLLVATFAYLLGWAARGPVLFLSIYLPMSVVGETLLNGLVPYFSWYAYGTSVGNAVNHTYEVPRKLPEGFDGRRPWLEYYPEPWFSVGILAAYAVVALVVALLRNRRSPLL